MKKISVIALLIVVALLAGYFVGQFFASSKEQEQQQQDALGSAWDKPVLELIALHDGKSHQLKEWQGKIIILNFWATWCTPCRTEIPEFIRFQEEYADKGVQFIGVGLDEAAKLRGMHKRLGMNYPSLVLNFADSSRVFKEWGNTTQVLPYTVVIDRSGTIVHQHIGQLHRETLEEKVLPLL